MDVSAWFFFKLHGDGVDIGITICSTEKLEHDTALNGFFYHHAIARNTTARIYQKCMDQ